MDQIQGYHRTLLRTPKCLDYLLDRRISLATAHKFCLGYYDGNPLSRLHDRLILPIHNQYGELVSMQGRALFDYKAKNQGKYWHAPFDKQQHLYGIWEMGRVAVESASAVVLVEGGLDVVALSHIGVPAFGTLGTALSKHQAYLVRRYTQEVLVWLEEDAAGQRALDATVTMLHSVGLSVGVIRSDQKDAADTWAYGGREAILEAIHAVRTG